MLLCQLLRQVLKMLWLRLQQIHQLCLRSFVYRLALYLSQFGIALCLQAVAVSMF
jgi:hypothetical protein